MQPFEYVNSANTESAISQYSATSQFLAGGTSLVDLMKLHVQVPNRLVDVSTLPLKSIVDQGDRIEVGALVNNNEMALHPLIKNNFPFVSEALLAGASVQLRNLATTGGNILQKTRCVYFRDLHAKCNKRNPGSGCDALEGYNRMNAILGGSSGCIAVHPSDFAVSLMAAQAVIKTQGPRGMRETEIEKFLIPPSSNPQIETILEPGELIVAVSLPKLPWLKKSTYVKIRDRSSYAFALSSAAVAMELDGKIVKQVRIAMGGISAIPFRAHSAEQILLGKSLTPEKMSEAAKKMTENAQPRTHNAFKVVLGQQTLIRALQEVENRS